MAAFGSAASYAALWCKSNFSFLEGASHPEELVEEAHRLGLAALALTDRDGVYGVVRAHVKARELGLHLIIGAQVTIDDGARVVLLVRNRAGYANLCGLLSRGRMRSEKGHCSIAWDELSAHAGGTLALLGSEVFAPEREVPFASLREAFEDELFVALARHRRAEEIELEARSRARARALALPIVACNEVLYHHASRRRLQDVLTCIRHRTTLAEAGWHLRPNAEHDLKTPHVSSALFADDPIALENTLEIARRCSFTLGELRYRYPSERLPDGTTSAQWLRELTFRGARKRYGDRLSAAARAQIEKELALIEELDYCGYFLTVRDIVEYCQAHDILCQGRGSAANSVVCFCLEITAIDPVRMNFLFERFLSRERAEPPDIDLDIEHERREEVIQHVYDKYGRSHAAMVANVVCYRARSSLRDVGKALGLDPTTLERVAQSRSDDEEPPTAEQHGADSQPALSRRLGATRPPAPRRLVPLRASVEPNSGEGGSAKRRGMRAEVVPQPAENGRFPISRRSRAGPLEEQRPKQAPEQAKPATGPSFAQQLLLELASELAGFPRHLSIHPGGFLLGHEPIDRLVPMENATMEKRTVIQWDKDDIEAVGLFKVDLLALGSLTHLHHAFDLLRRHVNLDLSLTTVPGSDRATFEMICRADTVGVFQIESRAQMAMLPRLLPKDYYDLVIEVSIVRPGPITGGMVHPYLRRRRGEETVQFPHECLRPVLAKTLGVPLFQEQVMHLAIVAADYSPGEADGLRRDMAAWRKTGRIEKHRERLISRMCAKGIALDFAERVFQQIRGFGEYGFPESHAASFALLSYVGAWFKCHYPATFACALLNAQPMGFYSISTILEDTKRHGITICPIDVLASQWNATLELVGGQWAVRMGLRFVKGLPTQEGRKLRAAVDQLGSRSLATLARDSGLTSNHLTLLAKAGTLEPVLSQRRACLWTVTGFKEMGTDILDWGGDRRTPHFAPPQRHEQVDADYTSTQHSTRGHPLSTLRTALACSGLPSARELLLLKNGSYVRFAGLVICRQRPQTASGILFMTLEDETGWVNAIIRRNVYDQFSGLARASSFLGMNGVLLKEQNVAHLSVHCLWRNTLPQLETRVSSRDFR